MQHDKRATRVGDKRAAMLIPVLGRRRDNRFAGKTIGRAPVKQGKGLHNAEPRATGFRPIVHSAVAGVVNNNNTYLYEKLVGGQLLRLCVRVPGHTADRSTSPEANRYDPNILTIFKTSLFSTQSSFNVYLYMYTLLYIIL